MSTKPLYEQLKEEYPNTVVLQLRGNFFNAFDDSAIVIANIFGFKLNSTEKGTYKTGFPVDRAEEINGKKYMEVE